MRRRKRWFFLWILVPVLILGIVGYLFFYYLFDPALYKKIVEESLTQVLNKEVFIGKAKISLWDGIGFVFEDFHVKDHPSGPDLLYSRSLILKVKLLPLLKGEVKWKRIVFHRPILHLFRDREAHCKKSKGVPSEDDSNPLHLFRRLHHLAGWRGLFVG